MCVAIGPKRGAQLPKSSKGTIQRGVANEVYKDEIDRLYDTGGGESGSHTIPERSVTDIRQFILEIVQAITANRPSSTQIDSTTDLFSWGVNSVMAARIRTAMQKVSGPSLGQMLLTAVAECGGTDSTPEYSFRATDSTTVSL